MSELVFVLMPFAKEFDEVYQDAIRPTVEATGLQCIRADEIFDNQDIVEDIENKIREAVLLIADLSTENANVFYEVGYAKALNKEVILLTQNTGTVPFDVRGRRHIRYGQTRRQQIEFIDNLTKTLATVIPRAKELETVRKDQAMIGQELVAVKEEMRHLRASIDNATATEIVDSAMPVFHTARLNAKKVACQSNLKQLGLALRQYLQDYREFFPTCDKWCDEIAPYMGGNRTILACPGGAGKEYGYAMNVALNGLHMDHLTDPSRTPILFDSSLSQANASGGIEVLCRPGRHLGRNNIAFADGHVESVDDAAVKALVWTPQVNN